MVIFTPRPFEESTVLPDATTVVLDFLSVDAADGTGPQIPSSTVDVSFFDGLFFATVFGALS
jgi:hypothetical protein